MKPTRRQLVGVGIFGSVSIVVTAVLAGPSLTVAALSPHSGVHGFVSVSPVPRWPTGARSLGTLSSNTPVSLTVALAPGDPSALATAAADVSSPNSADYRHFLSSSEVASEFGPDPSAVSSVRSWLAAQGLQAGQSLGDGLIIPVSGSASAVASAFHTGLSTVDLSNGRVGYANTSNAEIPSSLASSIQAVVGLNDLAELHANVPQSQGHSGPAVKSGAVKSDPVKSGAVKSGAVKSDPVKSDPVKSGAVSSDAVTDAGAVAPCSTLEDEEGIDTGSVATASQLTSFYDLAPLYSRGLNGQGVTVALLEGGESYSQDDVAALNACDGTNTSVTTIAVAGGCAKCAVGIESTLDIETVMGFAPNADIQVYQAPDLSNQSLLDDEAEAVSLDEAQVVSASVGECEPDAIADGRGYVDAEDDEFMDMALQGQSMFAASGDGGSEACVLDSGESASYLAQLAVGDPASQPYVTSVGGTSIGNVTSSSSVESVWNNGPYDEPEGNGASTGGISELWSMPTWQVGFDTSTNSSGVACGAGTGQDCREVPDVSSSADPTRAGYLVVYDCASSTISTCLVEPVGGTSFSSPFWASLTALGDQGVGGTDRLGFMNPELYATDLALPSAFHDVTSGDNDYLANSNLDCGPNSDLPCYEATVGYDMATGLGTPDAATLFNYLDSNVPNIATTGFPDATVGENFVEGLTTIPGDGNGPFTWVLASGSLPTGLQLSPSGAVVGTPTQAGTFSFVVAVTDENAEVAAAHLELVVNSAPVVLTTGLPDATEGVAYNASLSATGGTAPLRWSVESGALPSGLVLSSSGSLTGTPSVSGVFNFSLEVSDANGVDATESVTLTIHSPSPSTASVLQNGVVGSPSKSKKVVVSARASLVDAHAKKVKANGSAASRITVTLRSADGRGVAGKNVTLHAISGRSKIVVVLEKSNAKGVAIFEVFDRTAQVVTYRAIDTSDKITLREKVTVRFTRP